MRLLPLFAPLLLVGCAVKPVPQPIDDPPALPPPQPEPIDGPIPPPRPLLREPDPTDMTPAFEGRKLFLQLQCIKCHAAEGGKGPNLEGVYGTTVELKGGGATLADDWYVVESIRNPRAKVVAGWESIMPAYDADQVPAEDLSKLVAYVRSLRKGGPKGEAFPAPVGAPK